MQSIYNIGIQIYILAIRITSLFNHKARKWLIGHKNIWQTLNQLPSDGRPVALFHCASLGEFEQGRPVIEAFRIKYPSYRILLTFFSPSGYEVRKNYPGADLVCYLPADTPRNATRFVREVNPRLVMFVKYEYWHNFINELTRNDVPFYVLSANFRSNQYFFRWWGKWFLKNLRKTSHFFVQHQASADLLKLRGIEQVSVTGDTRFDRVLSIAREPMTLPLIEKFSDGHTIMVAGSTWRPDEELLARLFNEYPKQIRLIIAPHEIHESHLRAVEALFPNKTVRFSQAGHEGKAVMIIDSIGMLSKLYRYGSFAYIGGGFGAGIHNVLEASVYGIPVIFGPNHTKFREAQELIRAGGGYSINDFSSFLVVLEKLQGNPIARQLSGQSCHNYVKQQAGATMKVMEKLKMDVEK